MKDCINADFHYIVRRKTFEGWQILPRYIEDYELVLIMKGQGFIMISGETFPVKSGDLICFHPNVEHSLWVEDAPYMEFYGMHFGLPRMSAPFTFPALLHLESTLRLEILFKSLHDIYRQKGYLYEWRMNLWVQQILCEIFAILHEKAHPIETLRIHKVLDYIHEDPCRPLTLEDLLKQVNIQKSLFLKSFRNVTGTTPTQYIIGQRLEYARDLLLETSLPVMQISENCGFSDALYFSRCFRKHFGMSPRQYRETGLRSL